MKLYSIRNWSERFETSQSRKVEGALTWVAIPTKQDGLGYSRIMARQDGPQLYAAWIVMVQVAAKCKPRGSLIDENGPFTAEDIALKSKFPKSLIEAALNIYSDKQIGWLLVSEWDSSGLQYSTGHNTTEHNNSCSEPPKTAASEPDPKAGDGLPSVPSRGRKPAECASGGNEDPVAMRFPVVGKGPTEWSLRQSKVAEYVESYPGINVMAQLRLALQWSRDNPAKRKTPSGMPRFLNHWLTKAQNESGGRVGTARPIERHSVSLLDNDL